MDTVLARGDVGARADAIGDAGDAELSTTAGGGAVAEVGGGVIGRLLADGWSSPIRESSCACVSPKERVCLRSAEVGLATMRLIFPGV